MIRELITEREMRQNQSIDEVSSIWGDEQTICGPVISLQTEETERTGNDEYRTIVNTAHFLPENLNITGTIEPEVRNRGIFRVVTYRTRLKVTGNFAPLNIAMLKPDLEIPENTMVFFEIGIPDMRGINREIQVNWNGNMYESIPGIPTNEISQAGVHCKVPVNLNEPVEFSFETDINGSHSLNFLPLGQITNINISSIWPDPSFKGAFLPDDHVITDSGFTAHWNILQLNRNFPQQWLNDQYSVNESSFGVELITPVDTYQKSERSVKYALLFIGLTFLVFFFSEMLSKIRIHAVNYLLVGVALILFYSLLTALSEHLAFSVSYLIAASTIIVMIAVFAYSLYHSKKVTATVIATLSALYAYLYIILQLSDYSLLMGNIGMVVILALVMYYSRKIDWYSTIKSNNDKSGTE